MKKILTHFPRLFFWSLWPLAIAVIHYGYLQARVDGLMASNNYLSAEISKVDEVVKEISELRRIRQSVLERVEIIQELEKRDAINNTVLKILADLHPSISLESIEYRADSLLLKGYFGSQSEIADLANALESLRLEYQDKRIETYDVNYKINNDRFSLEMKIGD